MKKLDLSQTITILANLGVIAGIVFLVIELQQNNELLQTQAGYILAQNRVSHSKRLQESPEFSRLIAKLASGEPLTEAERWQEIGLYNEFLNNWRWEYYEYQAGRIDRSQLPVFAWRAAARGQSTLPTPGLMEHIKSALQGSDSEFAQFLNENVVNWDGD
jgi:hypothetical protein